jgi:hypothetical protein
MQIKDGTPKFVPVIIQLDTLREVKLLSCVVEFVLKGFKIYNRVCDWFVDYYREAGDPFDTSELAGLLQEIANELQDRIPENLKDRK